MNRHTCEVVFWLYEDDLPDMPVHLYNEWFKCSRVIDGVRQFPVYLVVNR